MTDGPYSWLFTDKAQVTTAGALGGVVRWLSLRESWKNGFISVIVGGICALYLGPLATPVTDTFFGKVVLDPTSRETLSGFIVGVWGIALSGLLMDVLAARRKQLEDATLGSNTHDNQPTNDADKGA